MIINKKLLIIILLLTSKIVFSQNDKHLNWHYSMDILPVSSVNSYSSILLTKDVYKYLADDLGSIRVVDEENNFIPYYFDNYKEKENNLINKYSTIKINREELEITKIEYDLITRNKEEIKIEEDSKKSVFDFQVIRDKDDYKGNFLNLKISGEPFSKQVTIEGRYQKSEWENITTDSIYNLEGYSKLTISLDSIVNYEYFRITIFNNRENINIEELKVILDKKSIISEDFNKTEKVDFKIENDNLTSTIYLDNGNNLKIKNIIVNAMGTYKRDYVVEDTFQTGKLYNFQHNSIDISSNLITLGNTVKESYKVVIKNNDNPPLHIEEIKINYTIDRVVFKSDSNKNYRLLFGNKDAKEPKYDIEDFREYIKDEEISESSLSNFKILREESQTAKVDFRVIFNVFIILLAIALFILIIFRLKPLKR